MFAASSNLYTAAVTLLLNPVAGVRWSGSMSTVGCFGDCGFGPSEPPKPKNFTVVFHPPIQTILKEKDNAKW